MSLEGTNTYVVGENPAYVIDPGPAHEGHVAAVREVAEERGGIAGILLTHSHRDHTEAVPLLDGPVLAGQVGSGDELTNATPTRPPAAGEVGPFRVLPTPGHAADHVCLVLGEVCFCGDLVLGEGSTIVPPAALDGSLADYMESLERVRNLDPELMCPGHGPWITEPRAKLDEYIEHRRNRERRLLAALDAGERSRERLLDDVWDDVPEILRPAAGFAMEAHLEKLAAEGRLPEDLRD